ncbi:unnamed protein product [Clonostachys rhizophaga]|uniref:Uncharacterized protein n=1 Tax=Clonostachys rhizophaga TaxID=160324 RepID=A0A9N9VIU8_9HYPO|nr:unnamed protein product [Clonostachys rhizophaga]
MEPRLLMSSNAHQHASTDVNRRPHLPNARAEGAEKKVNRSEDENDGTETLTWTSDYVREAAHAVSLTVIEPFGSLIAGPFGQGIINGVIM